MKQLSILIEPEEQRWFILQELNVPQSSENQPTFSCVC